MAKVALTRCSNYNDECKRKVEYLIELLGGINKVVRSGDTVLIKPNMVVVGRGENGNITHPYVVEPLVKMCYEAGAEKIFVGDGAGEVNTYKVYTISGMKKILDKLRNDKIPVEFIDLNYDKNPQTNDYDAFDLGSLALNQGHVYRVAHTVSEVDVIISVPKLKSHNGAGITVSLKNIIGIAPGGYYGFPKRKGNKDKLPHFSDKPWYSPERYDKIWRTIIDLNRIALGLYPGSPKKRRFFTVVDGVVGGVYDRLVRSLPVWKPINVGVLIAGADPVAVDTVAAKIMCYLPKRIPTIVEAAKSGLGTMSNISIIGERIENFRKFFPPSNNWVNIIDFSCKEVWPHGFFLYLRKHINDLLFKVRANRIFSKTCVNSANHQ